MHIEGNVAIVTGAASGLGEASARRLHAAGAEVVVADLNDERGAAVAPSSAVGPSSCGATSRRRPTSAR